MENNYSNRILHLISLLVKGFLTIAGLFAPVLLLYQLRPPNYSDVGIPGDMLDGIGLMLFGLFLLLILLIWWAKRAIVEVAAWPKNLLRSGLSVLVLLFVISTFLVASLWLLVFITD